MSWTNQAQSSSAFANASRHSSSWTNQAETMAGDKLLMEDGSHLLLENGFNILLESTSAVNWANQTRH